MQRDDRSSEAQKNNLKRARRDRRGAISGRFFITANSIAIPFIYDFFAIFER
jgi:hypothetical protein